MCTTRLDPEPEMLKLEDGNSSGLSLETVAATLARGVSASSTTNDKFVPALFSSIVASGKLETNGVDPPVPTLESTVNVNCLTLVLPVSSLTIIPMVAVPERFTAGVICTVRLAPEPPKMMFDTGTSNGYDE